MDETISTRRALVPAGTRARLVPLGLMISSWATTTRYHMRSPRSGYSPSCSPSGADLKRFTSTSSSSPFKENTRAPSALAYKSKGTRYKFKLEFASKRWLALSFFLSVTVRISPMYFCFVLLKNPHHSKSNQTEEK